MKIIKNTTASPIFIADTAVTIAANSSYTIPAQDYLLWSASENIVTYINAGSIVINDGIRDLTSSYGRYYISHPEFAFNIRFLNDPDRVNGFTSRSVQEAIEESKSTAEGKARYAVSCGFDGNSAVGRYLEFNSNVDSNVTGFIVPRASILREVSLGVSANSTVTFQILKWNGTTETLLTSISLAGTRKNTLTGLNISLAALDEIRVKDSSGSCARPISYQFYQVV